MSTQNTQQPTMTEKELEREGGYFPKLFSTPWHSGEKQGREKRAAERDGSDLECESNGQTVQRNLEKKRSERES